MNSIAVRVAIALVAVAVYSTQNINRTQKNPITNAASSQVTPAVEKAAQWLASNQGTDGGWGQDGDGNSYTGNGVGLESKGNDVANTAVAALALLRAGKGYQPNVERAIGFILERIEASPASGLEITNVQGTQIQRKLGPYIDTFLASMLLAEADGTMARSTTNLRLRRGLEKCVAKIEQNQAPDGSWNAAGGWAPVLGTSLASRSLFAAQKKGVMVSKRVMERANSYTNNAFKGGEARMDGGTTRVAALSAPGSGTGSGVGMGMGGGRGGSGLPVESAGVSLYQSAQAIEQLSRTAADRIKNETQLRAITSQLKDTKFVDGFGSIGGEEFFSYLSVSEALRRAGGEPWKKWHAEITEKILKLQNSDGTWVGHHCITGRVALTSAAILNLTVDRAN